MENIDLQAALAKDYERFWGSIVDYGALPFDHMPAAAIYDQFRKGAILSEDKYINIKRRKFLEVVPVNPVIPLTLKDRLNKENFVVSTDRDFDSAILNTADQLRFSPKGDRLPPWLRSHGVEKFCELHNQGLAHSVELYKDGKLVAGVVGLEFGRAFVSMDTFSLGAQANNVAFLALQNLLVDGGYAWHEAATPNNVTRQFGGALKTRAESGKDRDSAMNAGKAEFPVLGEMTLRNYLDLSGDRPAHRHRRGFTSASQPA